MNREQQIQQQAREISIQCLVNLMIDRSAVLKAAEWLSDPEEWVREAARRSLRLMNADLEDTEDVWS